MSKANRRPGFGCQPELQPVPAQPEEAWRRYLDVVGMPVRLAPPLRLRLDVRRCKVLLRLILEHGDTPAPTYRDDVLQHASLRISIISMRHWERAVVAGAGAW